jgi:ribosomal protein L34E
VRSLDGGRFCSSCGVPLDGMPAANRSSGVATMPGAALRVSMANSQSCCQNA